ncbi:MAG: aldehyde dehydrogenase family protein [Chloroflexota bacterium]|nr:aldehyde dehydrogenase family protein [Chloroflexota bacterium]
MAVETATLSHYVAGEWLSTSEGEHTVDVNPSDARQVLAHVPQAGKETLDRAVEAATTAFRPWKRATGQARANVLHAAANLLAQRRDDLARVMAEEVGKPLVEAGLEADRGVMILRYFAEEAVHPNGAVIPAQQEGSLQFTIRQPLGPVAVISPWNFPLAIPLWKIAPALAYGNTIVWKPAEVASLTAHRIAEVFHEGGLPEGVLNLLLGKGSVLGDALVGHEGIRGVTFTGSDGVGARIAESAVKRNIKYQLEMGGKNAALVLADADLDHAAQLVAGGAFRFAGQKCTATSRVIVTNDVVDTFVDKLTQEIKALPLLPATDPKSAVGPLITSGSRDNVRRYSEGGATEGEVVLGGGVPSGPEFEEGYFWEPTLIVGVSPDAPVAQEEVFGPLLVVERASDIGEAIEIANGTKYGLSVSLFTRDINTALEYINEIDCGMVRVNGDTTGVDPHAPFGGMRGSSSHSREQGPAAVEFFTEIKTVQINTAGQGGKKL